MLTKKITTTKQNLYFISIKDEQTKYIYSELIKHAIKNAIIEFLKNAIQDFKNVNNLIKKIQTNYAGSFNMSDFIRRNESFEKLLKDNNIKH